MDPKIAVIGGGNMGSALVAGLVEKGIASPTDILVCEIDQDRRERLNQQCGVKVTDRVEETPGFADTLLLAVKPMHLTEVGSRLKPLVCDRHLVISILAGQSRRKLGSVLGGMARVVRVMPNLPAQLGAGISAVTFGDDADNDQRKLAHEILSTVGQVVEVEEELQDAVTAVSGSGPGFLFYLAAQMIKAAEAVGLSGKVARQLVVQTMLGTARFLAETSEDPADLVRKVATPGGTTEAGLEVLTKENLTKIVSDTIRRATERSRELGQA
ncbi:MAG: pyrroline-5-carboxylate reductase [bacterium]